MNGFSYANGSVGANGNAAGQVVVNNGVMQPGVVGGFAGGPLEESPSQSEYVNVTRADGEGGESSGLGISGENGLLVRLCSGFLFGSFVDVFVV